MSLHTATLKKSMLKALEKSRGIVTVAAESAGIDRTVHYKWLKDDPDYKAAVDDIADLALDFVEGKLLQKIEGVLVQQETKDGPVVYEQPPSDTAAIFYLKCKGKKRGYIERTEITGADGDKLQIIISKDL